ncbi:Glycerol-3-phosphate acyltransferase [Quillaja saponaria]|uniref:Glycerol-3-phosphate acyltransferase n=1 Tax=Quillaja saponaria TaxID=32244 RepID=A0AAD7LX32_QUISA|nr:Glycerol-3-phosphate acyltransferase [Quillaja saponaria]
MATSIFRQTCFLFLLALFRKLCNSLILYRRKPANMRNISHVHKTGEISNKTLIFHLEGVLLRSNSLFPYFMLVAFEAGGFLRSFILFLCYPLIWLVGEDQLGLKIMVFLSFFGIKKESFRIGTSVLPKFFLEDVGYEGFEVVMSCKRKIAVSNLPRVMVEGFLKEYLGVKAVVASEMKLVCGYFVGLMEETKTKEFVLDHDILGEGKAGCNAVGIGCYNKYFDQQLLSLCKEVYYVSTTEKRKWHTLPREKYPKPLIFHDGRLAFRPTPIASLAMFMWLPLGLFLCIIRFTSGAILPFKMCAPIHILTGTRLTVSRPGSCLTKNEEKEKGVLYVCNHRTLLDPLYVAYVLNKPVSAVTYSLSRFSEVMSPIKAIPLTRDREKDRKLMKSLLSEGNLVVCPEGTTCREPYLLRFSHLFAELTDDIVPVAVDVKVSMFYGTTASGRKCLDPIFHFLNPNPVYSIKLLEKLPRSYTCKAGAKSNVEVANYVQNEIAKALGFQCTGYTRKDKYMILAGDEGIVRSHDPPIRQLYRVNAL